jgi:hypothetical protein
MKPVLNPLLIVLFLAISLLSCNNEELFVEPTADVVTDPDTSIDTDTPIEDTNSGTIDSSLPCTFNLDNVQSGDTVIINCVMDLGGQTVMLPANVTIIYEGGEIVNGTLNFSDNTIISGDLLNSSIILTGNVPQLKDTTFNFNPQRWGIVEGITTSEIAQRNNDILEGLMLSVKEMGVNTFKIGKLDAYFEVSKVTSTTSNQNYYPSEEAINVPSNFNLIMSDNTYLRVQPNSQNDYVLLAIRDASNVKIEGGNLYGDRDKHDDSQTIGNSGHVIMIHGGDNVDINGVKLMNGTGDGIDINSLNFTFQSNYIPSNNIRITNCVFDNNRRNNMSITDGFNILVDGNTFLNAGVDNPNSVGVLPGWAIDVEAVRGKENGQYIYYEKAYDITISNNIERGSKHGAFIVAIGEKTTILNNNVENGIAIGDASEVKIIGNTLTSSTPLSGTGIVTGHPDSITTYNNVISENTITGYEIAIAAYLRDTEIYDNTLIDFSVGILTKNISNYKIYRNIFNSSISGSSAIFGHFSTMNNVDIYENIVQKINREGINMVWVNKNPGEENNTVTIRNNNFNKFKVGIESSQGISFTGNSSEYVSVLSSQNINLSGNTITAATDHGIQILNGSNNINVSQNNITVANANKTCVYKANSTNISEASNTCN